MFKAFYTLFKDKHCYGSLLGNRLVNLGISEQQHLYLRTKNLILKKNLTKSKRLRYVTYLSPFTSVLLWMMSFNHQRCTGN